MLDPDRLVVAELIGRITMVNVHTGASEEIAEGMDQPTSLVQVGGSLWVTEGQTLRLVSGQSPNLPFKLRLLFLRDNERR